MLVQKSVSTPAFTIGVNGLAGNLGIAFAALVTGFLVKRIGWRAAFAVPAAWRSCAACFSRVVRPRRAPAKGAKEEVELRARMLARVAVMTAAAVAAASCSTSRPTATRSSCSSASRACRRPGLLGALLALIYTIASFAQLVVGKLIDRYPLKWPQNPKTPYII